MASRDGKLAARAKGQTGFTLRTRATRDFSAPDKFSYTMKIRASVGREPGIRGAAPRYKIALPAKGLRI